MVCFFFRFAWDSTTKLPPPTILKYQVLPGLAKGKACVSSRNMRVGMGVNKILVAALGVEICIYSLSR